MSILEIKNLNVFFKGIGLAEKQIINNFSTKFKRGEITGIVGESGSGKTITMKSIMNILPERMYHSCDELIFNGRRIEKAENIQEISMIFQDSLSSLNPLRTIEFHIEEVVKRFNPRISSKEMEELIIKELSIVGFDNPKRVLRSFPHELSGGMIQRIMIAMALLKKPRLLIADEPTTALDVTIQEQILKLIVNRKLEENLSVIFVTHDLPVVEQICDSVKVMFDGKLVEEGSVDDVFNNPQHLYTKELLKAIPIGKNRERLYTMSPYKLSEDEKNTFGMVTVSGNHRVLKEESK